MAWQDWCIGPAGGGVFPPLDEEGLRELVRQDPALHGCDRSRWRRRDVQERFPPLRGLSLRSVSRHFRHAKIRLKRGRLRLHSPDPDYLSKRDAIWADLERARADPDRITVIYGDEASVYRQPTIASRWGDIGTEPTADLSHRANTRHRLCSGLDAVTGQVIWTAGSTIRVSKLRAFLRRLREVYPDRELILVWDNWPVHHHPDVLAEAERLDISIRWLPTYAPWLNPIEKLWRWLKHDRLHHHRYSDRWTELKAWIAAFLDQFSRPSPNLLRYTGLSV